MASLVRKLRPSSVLTVVVETKDSLSSYEYSLVVVYNGSSLSYSIPKNTYLIINDHEITQKE